MPIPHEIFLKKALALAELRRGFCAPNPSVGAVLVFNGEVVAQGYHWAPGQAHAEVEALKGQTGDLSQHTLYVTLEPCCHFGRTPPCTDLIIQSGIRHVVYGQRDPNPVVGDIGQRTLRAAQIHCERLKVAEIEDFYASYQKWTLQGLPTLTTKIALSLDGKIAGPGNIPIVITGERARTFTHAQRRQHDAILTTADTILADNPRLNCRTEVNTVAKPLYVLDRKLRTPLDAAIFDTAASVTFFYEQSASVDKRRALEARNAKCIAVKTVAAGLDLPAVLRQIGNSGVHDLWVEAGGKLFSSLARQNLIDRAFFLVAPKWFGPESLSAFSSSPLSDDAKKAKFLRWTTLGEDALLEMRW